jgi:hypothetical protein
MGAPAQFARASEPAANSMASAVCGGDNNNSAFLSESWLC